MPQSINLNSTPYFDDFEESKNYKKVLFKPGVSLQARELTSLQSALQSQIEVCSNAIFSEGQILDGGNIDYISDFSYVTLEDNFNGIPVINYLNDLIGLTLIGSISGIKAKVISVISTVESDVSKNTLYVKYLRPNPTDPLEKTFRSSEELLTNTSITIGSTTFFQNTSIVKCFSNNHTGFGSAVKVAEGKTYLRGFFVTFDEKLLILDQYSNKPNYKIGFEIGERIITSLTDSSLNDNARGFSNFASPGADRLEITCNLNKKNLEDLDTDTFIEILRLENGQIKKKDIQNKNNFINDEIARRTYDESGDYIINDFNLQIENTLNDLKSNDGIYLDNERTYKNNVPSDDLMSISISPGKAYIRGYEVEKISNTIFEVEKSRDTKIVANANIPINFGKKIIINNMEGDPEIGINNSFLELRDARRSDDDPTSAHGNIIGYCRVYDTKLREEYSNKSSEQDLYVYDMQFTTELVVSDNIVSYGVGALIEGKYSGAKGYIMAKDELSASISGISTFSIFTIGGDFLPSEPYSIDGKPENRNIISSTKKGFVDVKSVRNTGTAKTFSGDLLLNDVISLSSPSSSFNITGSGAGISTITSTIGKFERCKVGDIIKFSISENTSSLPNYLKIDSKNISGGQITVSQITATVGVNSSILPSSDTIITDVSIVYPQLEISKDPGFFASLPENLISNVNNNNSTIRVRKEFENITVSSGSASISSGSPSLSFLPYTIDRYILLYSDGVTESLNSQKVVISGDSRTITFRSLSKTSATNAKLIATMSKSSINLTTKNIRSDFTVISNSVENISGTGNGTLNDGLTPDFRKYGTRVQDVDICLNYSDVIRVNGIFESEDINDPKCPTITLTSITNDLTETIPGEEFYGETSGALGKVIPTFGQQSNTITKINFVYLNSKKFKIGENIVFRSSGIKGIVDLLTFGSKNITTYFKFDNGQRNDYYDYSRIIRLSQDYIPNRRILVLFERYNIETANDFVTLNGYEYVNYSDIPSNGGIRNSQIIDFRPRASFYNKNTSDYGPFYFHGDNITSKTSSSIIIDDETILLDYSFYLPRIDKISLSNDGIFEYKKGISSSTPQIPSIDESSLDLFTIYNPAYTFDVDEIRIDVTSHKRYTMKDIRTIESRVENLEKFTTLSLMELDVNSLIVSDRETGFDRFKTGFLVDTFVDEGSQDTKNLNNTISIDAKIGEMRPKSHTKFLDLVWGSKSFIGIGTDPNPNVDLSSANDLESTNLTKTGSLVTLKYENIDFLQQPYANTSISVNSSNISNYIGNIDLHPSSDIWFNDNFYKKVSNSVKDPYRDKKINNETIENTNFYENRFDSWKDFWVGRVDEDFQDKSVGNIQGISYNSNLETNNSKTISNRIFNKDIVPYLRRRNYSFTCTSLKPEEEFYAFLDKISISGLIIPKLIEIEMSSGSFSSGEDVIGFSSVESDGESSISIKFRLAKTNHMIGSYNSPSKSYSKNPYTNGDIQSEYSQTSTILNVDLNSLSDINVSKYYGYIMEGMTLIGQTSGAKATISRIRLKSNQNGILQGAFYIPQHSLSNRTFLSGKKNFKLSNDSFNNEFTSEKLSFAEINFDVSGNIPLYENEILSVRSTSAEKLFDKNDTASNGFVSNLYENNDFINRTVFNTGYSNPIAQVFEVSSPSGIFITSIDLYFAEKSTDNLSITLDIRTIKNGLPTSIPVPFSKKTLIPNEISVSTDSSSATTFTFDSPVFLESNKLYAFTLYSDSENYKVYCSNLSTTSSADLITGSIVNKVSSVGNLYQSSNITPQSNNSLNLKFNIKKAKFVKQSGSLTFYNPNLDIGNNQKPILRKNPAITLQNKKIIGLSTTIVTSGIATLGLQVTQSSDGLQTGFIVDTLGVVGLGTTSINVTKVGTGLTPTSGIHTYTGVTFNSLDGKGSGLIGDITVNNGSINNINVTNGGSKYSTREVLVSSDTIGNTGIDFEFSVGIRTAFQEFVIDKIQGEFNTSKPLLIRNVSSGSTTTFSKELIPSTISNFEDYLDGLHFIINHNNHSMNSDANKVDLNGLESNLAPTTLSSDMSATALSLTFTSSSEVNFNNFEGVGIGTTNPGYVKIGNEIISYESISGNTLSDLTRGIDSTVAESHTSGEYMYKHEMSGISLRRFNKEFNFSDTTTFESNNSKLYYLKLDMSENGVDRSTGTGYPKLFIDENSIVGGPRVSATQNILFNSLTSNIQTFVPNFCNVSASVRTITGTSINGNETSFRDMGYEPCPLNQTYEFDTSRLVASRINELQSLTSLPGNKSLTFKLDLYSSNENLSPVVDLDRCGLILNSNIINDPIENYAKNSEINTSNYDTNEAIYISKVINLEIPSNGIKIIFDAFKPEGSDFRVLYQTNSELSENPPFVLFPGYNNLDKFGNVINSKNNDGSPDIFVNFSKPGEFKTNEFTVTTNEYFTSFAIKIVMTSTNSSNIPKIRNLKVLSLA